MGLYCGVAEVYSIWWLSRIERVYSVWWLAWIARCLFCGPACLEREGLFFGVPCWNIMCSFRGLCLTSFYTIGLYAGLVLVYSIGLLAEIAWVHS